MRTPTALRRLMAIPCTDRCSALPALSHGCPRGLLWEQVGVHPAALGEAVQLLDKRRAEEAEAAAADDGWVCAMCASNRK